MVSKLQIGMNVKIARTKANINIVDLAKLTGLSVTTISHIENGMTDVKMSTLSKIANATHTTVDELLKE